VLCALYAHRVRPIFFCSARVRKWPISTFSPVRSLPLRTGADIGQRIGLSLGQTWLGRPRRRGGSRSISRPSDRSIQPASGLGPFGSRSLRREHRRACGMPASITPTIETGATISPASLVAARPRLKGLINAFFLCLIFRRPASRLKPANFNFDQNLPAQILHLLFDSDLFNKNQHLRNHQSRARGEGKLYSAAARAPPEWAETM
jgi:hypothetical protein